MSAVATAASVAAADGARSLTSGLACVVRRTAVLDVGDTRVTFGAGQGFGRFVLSYETEGKELVF